MATKWKILIALVVVGIVLFAADRHGYNRAMDKCESERAEAIEQALADRAEQSKLEREIAREVITDEQSIRDHTEQLQREARDHARTADNPMCFGPDRLQRIRDAIHPD